MTVRVDMDRYFTAPSAKSYGIDANSVYLRSVPLQFTYAFGKRLERMYRRPWKHSRAGNSELAYVGTDVDDSSWDHTLSSKR